MVKTESVIVGVVLGILCPLLLFVFCWWTTAAIAIAHILPIPESGVAVAAFTGLALGVILDVLYLKKWIPRFYSVDIKLLVLVYLFCSAIAIALFMGLPFGNVALGTLAGVYVGRREYHAAGSGGSFARTTRRASIFTALVAGAEALPIGLLALGEGVVLELLQVVVELDQSVITGPVGVGLVGLLCVVLMVVQFWCTRTGARLAFRFGRAESA